MPEPRTDNPTLAMPDGTRIVASPLHVDLHGPDGARVTIEAADVAQVADWLTTLTRGAVIYEDGNMRGVEAYYGQSPSEVQPPNTAPASDTIGALSVTTISPTATERDQTEGGERL